MAPIKEYIKQLCLALVPAQSGNAGKVLSTDGNKTLWTDLTVGQTQVNSALDSKLDIKKPTAYELLLNYGQGGWLTLLGKDFNRADKGGFILGTTGPTLAGKPDGSLSWGGHEVARVVSSGKSADGTQWYRKYNDGYIEQAGLFDNGRDFHEFDTVVTFLAPFSSSVYSVQVTPGTASGTWDGSVIAKDLTTTSMYIGFWGNAKARARYLYWFACGY